MSITLFIKNPVGMVLYDVDGNRWSTVTCREPSYVCMDCGQLLATAYFTQRDGSRRYLCPKHVELIPQDSTLFTQTSGYSVQFPQPAADDDCPTCRGSADVNCPHCPPYDEALYIADWRGRVERGELDGYDEAAGLTGYERLMEAPHE